MLFERQILFNTKYDHQHNIYNSNDIVATLIETRKLQQSCERSRLKKLIKHKLNQSIQYLILFN